MGKRKRSSGDHNKTKYNSSSGNVSVLSSFFFFGKNDFVVVWLPDKMVRNEAKKGNFES